MLARRLSAGNALFRLLTMADDFEIRLPNTSGLTLTLFSNSGTRGAGA